MLVPEIKSDIWLELVLEVGNESEVVFELNHDGLVVIGLPAATDVCFVAVGKITSFAKTGITGVIRPYQNGPYVLVSKGEPLIVFQYLDFIWELMGTGLLRLKKVYSLSILGNMKVPHLIMDLLSQT